MTDTHRHVPGRLLVLLLLVVASIGASAWQRRNDPPAGEMRYAVDPAWPRPLPAPRNASGQTQQWVTGDVSGSCIDARDHLFVVTRGFQRGGITTTDGTQSIASPPVLEFDAAGILVNSWGDPTQTESGGNAVMPNATHGCFVDFENNVWIGGNGDGVLQKWSRDGKLLMQIGEKGNCDGVDPPPPPPAGQNWFGRPNRVYPTCAEPGQNASRTRLNGVADVFVDPAPDPVTGQRGSIYIADGYGNNRIVVFDAKGNYLRQWGSAGSGPGPVQRLRRRTSPLCPHQQRRPGLCLRPRERADSRDRQDGSTERDLSYRSARPEVGDSGARRISTSRGTRLRLTCS